MRIKKLAAGILVAALTAAVLYVSASAATAFPDVTYTNRYYKAISLLGDLKVVGGDEAGNFRPLSTITRAEFAKILYVIYNGTPDAPKSPSRFPDVADGAWYNGYVGWAAEKGIVGGRDTGLFDPDAPVTVAEVSKMFVVAITGENTLSWPEGYIERANDLRLYENVIVTDTGAGAQRQIVAGIASNALYKKSPLLSGKTPALAYFDGAAQANIKDFSHLVKDGDWTPAFTAALSSFDVVYLPAGTYNTTGISLASGKTLYGDGEQSIINVTGSGGYGIRILGTQAAAINVTADVGDFSNRITVASTAGLSPGNTIYILSQRSFLVLEDAGEEWCLGGNYEGGTHGYFGEFATIRSISGNTITLAENLKFPSYLSHNKFETRLLPDGNPREVRECATVRRVDFVQNTGVYDLAIHASDAVDGVALSNAKNCVVENVKVIVPRGMTARTGMKAFYMQYAVGCEFRGCESRAQGAVPLDLANPPFNTPFFPFRIASSIDSGIVDCVADCFMILINYTNRGGPSTGCYITGSTVSNAVWGGIAVGQGTLDTLVENCRVLDSGTGIRLAGRDTVCRNNYIELNAPMNLNYRYVRPDTGGAVGIMLTEGYAIDVIVENNIIKNCYTGICVRDGYELSNIYTYGSVILRNNTIEGCKQGLYTWKVTTNKGADKLDILFEGNTIKETAYVNMDYGLRLCLRTVGIAIKNNIIEGAETALCLEAFSGGVEFVGNTVKNSLCAVEIAPVSSSALYAPENRGLETVITITGNTYQNVATALRGAAQAHVNVKG